MSPSGPFATLDGPSPVPVIGWRGTRLQFVRDPVGYTTPLRRAHGDVVTVVRGGAGPVVIPEATAGTVFAFGPACLQAVWSQMGG